MNTSEEPEDRDGFLMLSDGVGGEGAHDQEEQPSGAARGQPSQRSTGPIIDAEFEIVPRNPDDPDDPSIETNPAEPTDPDEEPLFFMNGDNLTVNPPAIAAKYAKTKPAAYSAQEGQHYTWDAAERIWNKMSRREAIWNVSIFLKAKADEMKRPELLTKRTPGLLSGIIGLVEGHALMGSPPPPSAKLFAASNGILSLSGGKPALRPPRKEDWFTSKSPYCYVPQAKCERFLNELVRPALADPDDINLLQRDFGRMLIPGNKAQTISILTGPGGSGKSVLVSILERMIGTGKVAYLRTDKLNGRFETHGLQGKTLAVGKDVKPNYLAADGASLIKSITGADRIESEQKYGGKFELRGNFYVIITANSRLPIKLADDASAWRRRLVCYNFTRETPSRRIPNFDEELLRAESDGILAWLVEGYRAHERELEEHGTLKLTEAQQRRVDDWLMESEGELAFARLHVSKGVGTVSVEELWQAYAAFASELGWRVPSKQIFFTKLPEVMMAVFGVERDNHIMRNGAAVRGFKGVVLTNQKEVTHS